MKTALLGMYSFPAKTKLVNTLKAFSVVFFAPSIAQVLRSLTSEGLRVWIPPEA